MRISLGSGATLATQVVDGSHYQIISGVTLNPSPNYIGLASVNVGGTLPALSTGTNFIGLATVVAGAAVPVTDNSGSLTVDWTSGATVAVSHMPNVTIGSAIPAGTNNIGDVDVLSIAAGDNNIGNVDLASAIPAGSNYIGLVTTFPAAATTYIGLVSVSGTVGISGIISLASGTEVRSLATINNWPATQAVTQSGTWNVGITGLVSLASGTFVSLNAGTNHIGSVSIFGSVTANTGMTTLFPGPNFIGLVTTVPGAVTPVNDNGGSLTVDGTVGISGLISLASGTFVSLNAGTNNIGDVDVLTLPALPAGANFIGLATVTMSNSIQLSQVTLFPSPNYIGLVTAYPGAAFPVTDNSGSLTVDGTVGVSGLISLASGTEIRSLATVLNFPATQAVTQSGTWNVGVTGLISLASGTELRSLATVLNWPTSQVVAGDIASGSTDSGNPVKVGGKYNSTLPSFTDGQRGDLQIGSRGALRVELYAAGTTTGFVGSADNADGAATSASANKWPVLSRNTVYNGTTWDRMYGDATNGVDVDVTRFPSGATVSPLPISTYTSLQTVQGVSGAATLVVPPNNQRWILKDIFASAYGAVELMIASATVPIIPYSSLATQGGYVANFGDSGVRANAVNQALVINTKSLATVSYMVNVRFE